jgi:CHAT domain-containing protein
LLIVGDGPLFYLPFAALHDGERFLVERFAMACAPSASVLDPALVRRRRAGGASLLAVGNPASFRTAELMAGVREPERWRFPALPYAEEEARRVASLFPRPTVLTGNEATEETIKSLMPAARYIHFATHGLFDEREPLLSGLALAQDDDPAEDGLLQVHEILRLPLAAEVVTLSACNTGLGRLMHGEGVLGLSRAFLHAGARSLLLSLWEVPDRSTARLMERCYIVHREDRRPLDLALQQAQREAMATGSPREWAAFVVMGDVAAGVHRSEPWSVWILAALALVAAGLVVLQQRRVRRRA